MADPLDPFGAPSRRRFVLTLALGGAALGIARPAGSKPAPAKLLQAEIGYQPTPKGAQRCDLCVNWQAPGGCKVVAGTISPAGWCGLFVRRA